MKEHLKDLLEYSHHFNIKIIKKFNDGDLHFMISDNTKRLFSHMLNAQALWNLRMENIKDALDIWQVHQNESLEEIEKDNFNRSMEILENTDLDTLITYKNLKGEQYANTIQQILFHIVNHSTYHRGQIAVDLRSKGIDPVASDYIIYKRDNFEEV